MNTDNSILVSKVMFPNDFCDSVIDIFENKSKKFTKTHFQKNYPSHERKDETCYLDTFELDMLSDIGNFTLINDINAFLKNALDEYCEIYTTLQMMPIRSTRQKLQKTTKSGGFHVWHQEQSDEESANRVLVWSIYLNDVEEGGETEFLYQSKRIKAQKGKILIFPAAYTHVHRGNPPLSGDKYILTGWFHLF
tara:strand:+ start:31 stop:609 length:579 start_codon:yes stop_codon:yes gene_type:complete